MQPAQKTVEVKHFLGKIEAQRQDIGQLTEHHNGVIIRKVGETIQNE